MKDAMIMDRVRAWMGVGILLGYTLLTGVQSLPRSTPEAEGIPSSAILDFVHAADKNVDTFHSFMVLRHGKVIAEGWWKPNSAEAPHILNSVSKSFTSTAVGLAIDEHKLKLDDHVLKFFPADAPPDPSANLQAMTVRDLLTMSGGHEVEPDRDGGPTVKRFLAQPVVFQPGTHFLYNTMGTYVLSSIITKVTGQTALEYLKPRLFGPLGIQSPRWDASPEGNSLGGYGLYLRTEDIAKLGQLYLQKGEVEWQAEWVGLVHIADVPERHEPGTGELDYTNIYRTLGKLHYSRFIGMEYAPTSDPVASLRKTRLEAQQAMAQGRTIA